MYKPIRLHPVAIIVNTLKILKDAFLPFLAIIFIGDNEYWWVNAIMAGLYMIASTISGFVKWLTYTYHIENDGIHIHSGVFIKKKRYISFERIHSVDVTEGLLQRFFGLKRLIIDTAGSSDKEGEAVLTAISKVEADRIETLIENGKNGKDHKDFEAGALNPAVQKDEQVVFRMSHKQILVMALTSGKIGVVFAGAFALFGQLGDQIIIDKVFEEVQAAMAVFSVIFLVFLLLVVLVVAYAIAVIALMLKYAYFTVKKREGDLIITHGLLEKRQLTIPLEKIQGVRVVESIIRQPFGLATVFLETASGSAEDMEKSQTMLFPLIHRKQLVNLLEPIVEQYTVDDAIKPLPKKALPRYIGRQWLFWIPVIGIVIYFFRPIGYYAVFFLLFGAAWGSFSYKSAGWSLKGQQLTLRFRQVSRHTYIVRKQRIQSFSTRQSWFQQKNNLGTVEAYSKTGMGISSGTVTDVDQRDAVHLRDWFRYH